VTAYGSLLSECPSIFNVVIRRSARLKQVSRTLENGNVNFLFLETSGLGVACFESCRVYEFVCFVEEFVKNFTSRSSLSWMSTPGSILKDTRKLDTENVWRKIDLGT
jgi:hypothetical protein